MATMTLESAEEIKRRISELNLEHRDLDRAIEALENNPLHDELQLKRLKKRKLMLKDQIFMLQRQLVPDIPASQHNPAPPKKKGTVTRLSADACAQLSGMRGRLALRLRAESLVEAEHLRHVVPRLAVRRHAVAV